MAGSQMDSLSLTDPVLSARLEAVRLLGDRLTEPVTVIDRRFNLLYANRPAYATADCRGAGGSPTKCYAAFVRRSTPCSSCPAKRVFDERIVAPSTEEVAADCGLVKVFPLFGADGEPACVVQILNPSSRAPGIGQPPSVPAARPAAEPAQARLGELIGASLPMQHLFEMIRLVADSQATVLLQGESGTGKELVARTIHQLSYRRDKPFVVVDCGSLPETLLESELFGHVRGAFTGATANKKGLFEEADGGTLFLDEIANTSQHFQAKLLRVLQEGEIKPVGSSRSTKVNVRVVSATNKDLHELVKARAFREDLYYRLAVLPLVLPPLRDRREDIPLLVRHFIEASCKRHRKPVRDVAPDAMQALVQAPWPGNIRELQHTIERVVVTAPGPALTLKNFCGVAGGPAGTPPCADLRSVARHAVHEAERARILEALRQASGNRARAARLLKISRAGLYNKLRAYGIE
ncbi:MAG: sigma-54 dependent transcriptional regulator [Nitrospirota bacterium]